VTGDGAKTTAARSPDELNARDVRQAAKKKIQKIKNFFYKNP
jgi:hypothetical protein